MKTRNNKGQYGTKMSEEDHDDSFEDLSRIILRYGWLIFKLLIVLYLLCPFLDKVRQKDYIAKFIDYFNEIDLGCKKCICNETITLFPNKTRDNKADGGGELNQNGF
jgi:hypothetical protein